MMQIIPMTVEQALKAAETYASPINGDMVSVLAAEVKRLTAIIETPIMARIYKGNDVIVDVAELAKKCSFRVRGPTAETEGKS